MIILISLLFSFNAHSTFDWQNFETSSLQLGTWMENYSQVRGSRNDSSNGFELTPFISASSTYSLAPEHVLIPEAGWVIQRTDSSVKKNIFFVRLDYGYRLKDWLRLRTGSSFIMMMQSGEGGSERLENGDSTEVYYIPEDRRTTFNQTVDLGVEFFKDELSARVQSYIYSFFDENERIITYAISFNYNFKTEELFR